MATELPNRRPHRLAPAVYAQPHHACFLTICARHHGEPFRDAVLAGHVVRSLLWTRERYQWAIYAYCLMPDHLHFLCRPLEPPGRTVNAGNRGAHLESLLDHVARFKSYTTREAWRIGLHGHLWQRSSYDVLTDETRSPEEIARYILDNPVRKGLVATWSEWLHSGVPDRL
ncbi:transposase [Gemmata sp.]|uniref:transposase n=1 Tax=Gemmata sp. TaxID=1914242 RepID=UPI003F6EFC8A